MKSKKESKPLCSCEEPILHQDSERPAGLCKHYEKEMPKYSRQSIDAISKKDPEKPKPRKLKKPLGQTKARKILPPSHLRVPEHLLHEKFRECGLTEEEIEMVFLKFWDRSKNAEIAQTFGFTDHRRASEALKKILLKLQAAGFSLTDEDC